MKTLMYGKFINEFHYINKNKIFAVIQIYSVLTSALGKIARLESLVQNLYTSLNIATP